MNIFFHADDFGLSKGITYNILECVDKGILSSTSIIANGYAFDYAVEAYKKRPFINLACHLNLVEGRPVNAPDKVNLLVNNKGYLCNSFLSLWKKYLFSSEKMRKLLKNQIILEISGQIEKIMNNISGNVPLRIDSHQHLHMIPFVFTCS